MQAVNLVILGAGSVRCMPPIIGSLATYFGERPLDLRFWDSHAERLDLFDEMARLCFGLGEASHRLRSSTDLHEMAEGATHAILCLGRNCARGLGRSAGVVLDSDAEQVHWGVQRIIEALEPDVHVLNLMRPEVEVPLSSLQSEVWPGELTEAQRRAIPFDVLRLLSGEDYPYDLFREQASSPVRAWLDRSLTVV